MKFFKSSLTYLTKNFIFIAMFTLPASFFYAFLLRPISFGFLKGYKSLTVVNFGSITKEVFDFSWQYILISIAFLVIVALSFALLNALIEFHMRTGRMKLKKAFHNIGKYIIPTLTVFTILAVTYLFITFIFCALTYFIQAVTGTVGDTITKTGYGFVTLIYFILNGLFLAFAAFMIMSILSRVMTTNSFSASISRTSYLFEGQFISHFALMALVYFVLLAVIFFIGNFFLSELVVAVVMCITSSFLAVHNITAFFKLNKIERKDDVKKFF